MSALHSDVRRALRYIKIAVRATDTATRISALGGANFHLGAMASNTAEVRCGHFIKIRALIQCVEALSAAAA